jgi:hypothetical protein
VHPVRIKKASGQEADAVQVETWVTVLREMVYSFALG